MSSQPATIVHLEERPALKALVSRVCEAVGARIPDNVILNADPTFYVTQGGVTTFDGPVKGRTLAIGLPLVKAMDTTELSAVLAHEFAHFTGRDTIYSSLAAPVFRGLQMSVGVLSTTRRVGSSTAVAISFLQIPSLHFLVACAMHFHSITMIISRRRELRADWLAAKSFGTGPFTSALRKTVEISSHFPESMKTLSWGSAQALFSVYAALLEKDRVKLDDFSDKALKETESVLSSHPSLRTRIESLPPFGSVRAPGRRISEAPCARG
jgi:Zn-dependent protease with chaperone function